MTRFNIPLVDTYRGAYILPSGQSVIWTFGNARWPVSTVVDAYFHGHARGRGTGGMDDMWLFCGEPRRVFADLNQAETSHRQLAVGSQAVRDFLQNIKQRQMQPSAAFLACSYMANAGMERIESEPGSYADYYRKSRCALPPKDRFLVMIQFNSVMQAATGVHRQHASLRVYYMAPPDTLAILPDSGATKAFYRLWWSNRAPPPRRYKKDFQESVIPAQLLGLLDNYTIDESDDAASLVPINFLDE